MAFSSLKRSKKSTVRTLREIRLEEVGQELQLTFTGDGFLYHMVRILVGTLLAAGEGTIAPSEIDEIFQTGRRAMAGVTVPAKGLCLMEVQYP